MTKHKNIEPTMPGIEVSTGGIFIPFGEITGVSSNWNQGEVPCVNIQTRHNGEMNILDPGSNLFEFILEKLREAH